MSRATQPVHFANFICHFGDHELLDLLVEVILPAFLENHKRTYKDTKYFFHQVEVLNLDGGKFEPAICGRFVKDMIVRSEQRFDPVSGELERSAGSLETAPSAVFVLLLTSHKLLYLHETAAAPGLESFRSTTEAFLRDSRAAFIDRQYKRAKAGEEVEPILAHALQLLAIEAGEVESDNHGTLTKTRLRELIPPPTLEVVPLANEDTLRDFVNRFKILQSATVRLLKRNAELDNDDFFESVRSKGKKAGAETATITYKNVEGLAKAGVVGQLEAALSGNAEIKLEGQDQLGQKLRGSNEEFKVVASLDTPATSILDGALRMLRIFRREKNEGLIRTGDAGDERPKVDRLRRLLPQLRDGR
jgi:hypothetical protein